MSSHDINDNPRSRSFSFTACESITNPALFALPPQLGGSPDWQPLEPSAANQYTTNSVYFGYCLAADPATMGYYPMTSVPPLRLPINAGHAYAMSVIASAMTAIVRAKRLRDGGASERSWRGIASGAIAATRVIGNGRDIPGGDTAYASAIDDALRSLANTPYSEVTAMMIPKYVPQPDWQPLSRGLEFWSISSLLHEAKSRPSSNPPLKQESPEALMATIAMQVNTRKHPR